MSSGVSTTSSACSVDQPACPHLADFVNAVSELVAAILDMNRGFAVRHIASVHISDARHGKSLCVARHHRAFSSEVGTGSREENASRQ